MADDPIDLSAERLRRDRDYDGIVCRCGCAWFDARVAIDKTGKVTGYQVPPLCAMCRRPMPTTGATP